VTIAPAGSLGSTPAPSFLCMARPLRLVFANGLYHVISRGNAGGDIYLDVPDRSSFLRTLDLVVDRFSWLCHAYCLMSNHYHLLIETPKPNLPLGMRQLNGVYAQRFNRRHARYGHLFQARYRSILVEKETHLLATARYIVLNPVRAGICNHPREYRSSSYRATVGLDTAAKFLTTDWILSQFGAGRRRAREAYRAFVESEVAGAIEIRGERVGSMRFLRNRHGIDPPLAEIKRDHIEPVRRPLDEIFSQSPHPISDAYRVHGYALREIAEHLGCHYSTISRRLREQELAVQDLTPSEARLAMP
jgi:putative transposase